MFSPTFRQNSRIPAPSQGLIKKNGKKLFKILESMYERIEALDKRVRRKENKYLKRQEDEQEDDTEEAADFEVTIQSIV